MVTSGRISFDSMKWERLKANWPAFVLVCIYLVGTLGFLIPAFPQNWADLTSINLLVSFGILISCHPSIDRKFILSTLAIAVMGFMLEAVGVKTGLLFGSYQYGSILGLKVLDTPLMIGINWIMLVYLSAYIGRKLSGNILISSIIAAFLMTGMDVLIEPFAIYFELWTWENTHVPMRNYAMWFVASFAFNWIYQKVNPKSENKAALPLFLSMAAFFLIVDLVVIWS